MTRIKICGITTLEAALAACDAGADALGFVFAESPRRVTVAEASAIVRQLPPFIARVGVFVDSSVAEIQATARSASLTTIQLHGSEAEERTVELLEWEILRAVRLRDESCLPDPARVPAPRAWVLDSYDSARAGGTGRLAPWDLARRAVEAGMRVILAGGLTPENVAEAIRAVRPWGVDVSSGVESSPGCKDAAKVRAFAEAVWATDSDLARTGGVA